MSNQIGSVTLPDIKMEKSAQVSLSAHSKGYAGNSGRSLDGVNNKADSSNNSGRLELSDVSVIINSQGQAVKQQEDKDKKVTPDEAKQMSEALNEFMDKLNCNIQFKYHEKLDMMSIQMINKKTKEVIKEFPPEEILKTMEKTQEWIGIFLDRNA